ncbi:MAG: hypothetical protein JNK79_03565 [Chitinophagaceae bacterium]|nr:hypothetical protein [Chitinophagaceae bacterium]
MKALTPFFMLLLPIGLWAQSAFTNQTHSTLQKVINDYPNHFKNIRGRLIDENPQTTDYSSTIQIPGALNTTITRYSATNDKEIYSWKCTVLESEDFELVSKKYREVYAQMKNSIIKLDGNKPFILNGSYGEPTDEKRFISSSFGLLPASGDLKSLRVELTLEFLVTEWKVSVLVYDSDDAGLAKEWQND